MSTKTRFPELNYRNDAPGLWRIVTSEDDAAVGPHYETKAELLADLDRYAVQYGCAPDLLAISRKNLTDVNHELRTEIETLRSENARLREALADIVAHIVFVFEDGDMDTVNELLAKARAALAGAK